MCLMPLTDSFDDKAVSVPFCLHDRASPHTLITRILKEHFHIPLRPQGESPLSD